MKTILATLALVLAFLAPGVARTMDPSTPEAQGVPSAAILGFVEAAEHKVDALHGFVLVRHGAVIAEGWWAPYGKDRPHMLYSLSKSFTSTAVGIAIDEGRLGLDDKVVSFFPDKVPADPGESLQRMRVRDLLCMGTGHQVDTLPALRASGRADWVRTFLAQPVPHEPGTHFCYNTGATYMLSAIIQQVTGATLLDYLTPRLFEPLGIHGATWETSPQGINTGGYGLKVRTGDIARLGQLYLQKGVWNGKRVVSEQWVAAAGSKQIPNGDNPDSDWNQGYGYQFWRCRHHAFRGDGAFGQYCVVMPDQDAVLAITGGLGNMQQVLDLAWDHLLPAMRAEPLAPDPAGQGRLREKLSSLTLTPVRGDRGTPLAGNESGRTYRFPENEKGLRSLSLNRDDKGVFLTLENVHGRQRVDCGSGTWSEGALTFEKTLTVPVGETNGPQPVAASGAWTAADRFLARIYFRDTPFRLDLALRFAGTKVLADIEYNVAFGARKWQLAGEAGAGSKPRETDGRERVQPAR